MQKKCFACNLVENKCEVLTELVCKTKKCPFFKTPEQFVADSAKAALHNAEKNMIY